MREQSMDLLAGEHRGKGVVIFGADLGKDCPGRLAEQIDKKHFGGGQSLSNGLGLPMLLELYEEEVVAQLGFGNGSRITGQMFVDEPQVPIIGMASAIGVVTQSQEVGVTRQGRVRVLVVDGIGVVPGRGPNARRCGGLRAARALFGHGLGLAKAAMLEVEVAGE